jgi:zinc transport system substrate-binding protein
MTRYIYNILLALSSTLLFACQSQRSEPQAEMMVSIAPLKYIVEQITADDFHVGVLVPAGASPETFDPTPRQMKSVEDATLLFTTGLIEFEQNIVARIGNRANIVELHHGIDLIEGTHEHEQHTEHSHEQHSPATHSHHHGIDPHIWTSPRELKTMARNAYDAIMQQYPDSTKYTASYNRLVEQLDALDAECRQMYDKSATRAFVIYHPALTYLARAYTIEQIAVEEDGKEPSARHIATLIDAARTKGVTCLLYQSQFPRSVVDVIARDMGVEAEEFDPLAENVVENIASITRLITATK